MTERKVLAPSSSLQKVMFEPADAVQVDIEQRKKFCQSSTVSDKVYD